MFSKLLSFVQIAHKIITVLAKVIVVVKMVLENNEKSSELGEQTPYQPVLSI